MGRSVTADPPTDRLLLNADEVADLLGMTRDWVYSETRAGRIPHVRLGRYYRYRRESIERWISESESGSFAPHVNGRAALATPPARHRRY